jgi:hypothetical protein
MPGPVDFEINKPGTDRLADVVVTGCRFSDCGGNAGEISFIAARGAYNASGRFEVSNNVFERYRGTGAEIQVDLQRETTGQSAPVTVVITGNVGSSGYRSLALKSGRNITSSGNVWENYRRPAIIGTARGDTVASVMLADRFRLLGEDEDSSAAVDLYDADAVDLTGATFTGCSPEEAPIRMTDGHTQQLLVSSSSFEGCSNRDGRVIEQAPSHRLASLVVDGQPASLKRMIR